MSQKELTARERKAYERQLRELTIRLTRGVAQLEAEVAGSTPAFQAEPGVRDADEEVARTLLASEELILTEANAALARLEAGTFGTCELCSQPISRERLDAMPYARTCIRCAREAERESPANR